MGARAVLGLALLLTLAVGCDGARAAPATPPIQAITVRITGHDFQWRVRYPGADGRLDTEDDVLDMRDLHLPLGAATTVQLRSDDYIYSVALPHLGLREIAVPELDFALRFRTGAPGQFPLRTDELCGRLHPELIGTVVIEPTESFLAHMKKLSGAR